jgi:hypothetical protein
MPRAQLKRRCVLDRQCVVAEELLVDFMIASSNQAARSGTTR